MIEAYFVLAAWFYATDMIAGHVAGVKCRPIAGIGLAVVWPISLAVSLVASAALVRAYRLKLYGGEDG